jgi:hypothetical protein
MKGRWVMDIPIFGKKHSSLQNNDILRHTLKVVGADDSEGFSPESGRPFSTAGGYS